MTVEAINKDNIFLNSGIELGVSLTSIGLICTLTTCTNPGLLLTSAAVQFVVNLSIRFVASTQKNEERKTAANLLNASIFSIATGINTATLLHEAGHFLAARLVYVGKIPVISISPFEGGSTSIYIYALTTFGRLLGKASAKAFVSGAGALLSLTVSFAVFWAAIKTLRDYEQLSLTLFFYAVADFTTHVSYAISSLTEPASSGHDFQALANYGIDPLLTAAVIGSIGIYLTAIYLKELAEKIINRPLA